MDQPKKISLPFKSASKLLFLATWLPDFIDTTVTGKIFNLIKYGKQKIH
jgi:hypothetical protein